MNNRIKELAAKSNFGHIENDEVVYDHRLEKFAELIVKECNNLNKQVIIQCNLEHYLVFDRIVNKYQEHFGVEE